jgi:hypothetical protein
MFALRFRWAICVSVMKNAWVVFVGLMCLHDLNVDVEIFPKTLIASALIKSFENMKLHSSIMKDITFHSYTLLFPFKHKLFLWLSLVVIY